VVNRSPDARELARLQDRVRAMVTPRRFEHIERVARLTGKIARANGFSEEQERAAVVSALLHDAARDLSEEELFRLAPPRTELEKRYPLMLHGRASRALAAQWGVDDPVVLDAVEGHVFGVDPGNRVGMALYVADVSEPGRGVNEEIRNMALSDLYAAYRKAVVSKVEYLRAKNKPVHPATLDVYETVQNS